jgi:hypothetical protein
VQLTALAVAALREHLCREAAEFGDRSQFVFTSRSGGPMDGSRATIGLAEALLRAGLPRVRVHDLRHTTASVLLEVGVHPKVVQDLLGHSTIAVTLDTYSHVAPGLHRERYGSWICCSERTAAGRADNRSRRDDRLPGLGPMSDLWGGNGLSAVGRIEFWPPTAARCRTRQLIARR